MAKLEPLTMTIRVDSSIDGDAIDRLILERTVDALFEVVGSGASCLWGWASPRVARRGDWIGVEAHNPYSGEVRFVEVEPGAPAREIKAVLARGFETYCGGPDDDGRETRP